MKHQKPWWQRSGVRIGIALVLLVLLGGAVGGGIYLTQTPPEQPIAFPHSFHVGMGADCTYCHTGAALGPSAGLPSNDKCWGCHQQIDKKSPELENLAQYVANNEPIPWVPVAIQPDFVKFNHQPHINAGVTCETCHGNVAQMTVAEPQSGQNMGWCLQCHQTMAPADKWARLSDCATCHY
jgi:hypothetical protein